MEAGGIVMDKNGGPINIMKPDVITAGTQKLANTIQALILDIDKKLEMK